MLRENIQDIIREDINISIDTLLRYIKNGSIQMYMPNYANLMMMLRYTEYEGKKDFCDMDVQDFEVELLRIKNYINK